MLAILVALLLAPPLALDEAAAAARLTELRDTFSRRPKAESVADLERLANDAPSTDAGGRAVLWLGDLARQSGESARARGFFERAYDRFPAGEVHRLAARGRGDIANGTGRYREAQRMYDEALVGASEIMRIELTQKRALAVRLLRRLVWAIAAWSMVAAAFVWFCWRGRLWRRGDRRPPAEALYVLPVYALLVAGCVGRDPGVLRALVVCGAGSTLLIAVSGLAARRVPVAGLSRWLHAAVLAGANLALFYAAIHQAGLVDTLMITIGMAAATTG